ncbi:putative tyrosine-protein kinase involved in exopolysaccharide biosynthesis [Flavobacterium psychrophilum]|uniref:GumC family protein n=1 Tax=Flavobacterium psychrophilum TaxID=96345 RepID=UPI0009039AAB|nr:tyrosine-protein kinase [Flavobacterium psychrophilum]EKT4519560.1 polysaccharide biosynthesis tyrosine autokinase [Flavobacterium psychrophilum]MCB6061229.1 polysaccharide biosynthesis tyrosine autokinase [Flavobacterium psychrophilum]OJH13896.1 tyrosine protein kinase [Flavobacterium psychrophilum]SNB42192.1 putative tyrosine-protein kinase involved in exopolysaccharide biosynthesis [Flavobacterium psychrophilum]
MFNTVNNNEENTLNIKDLVFNYLSHWKWFLLSIALFFIGAKLYLRYSIPEYKSQTTLLIKGDESGGMLSELSAFQDLGGFSGAKKDIDDEMEVLKSRSLIEKTIKAGKFYLSYVLEGRIKSSEVYKENLIAIDFKQKTEKFFEKDTTLIVKVLSPKKFELFNADNNSVGNFNFGQLIYSKELGSYVVNIKPKYLKNLNSKVVVHLESLKKATNKFKAKLNVGTITKSTNVLEISFTDPIKEKAEDFLNQLVAIYNNDAIIDKNSISEKTSKFINERLAIITGELDGVEKDVEKYKNQNQITDLSTEAELNLKNSSESTKEEIIVATQLKVVGIMIDFIRKNNNEDIIPANIVPDDNNSSALIAEYNNLVIERNRVLKSSTSENPVVIRVNDKIDLLKSSISESLNRLKSSLVVKNNAIINQGNIVEGRISKIPRQEREFRGIFRQQQIKEELYLYLFKKREETAITLAATAPISRVVDYAYSSDSPISPKKSFIYLFSLILGFFIPFSIIYILDLLDTKVKTRHDLDNNLSIPFIGDVPHSDENNQIMQAGSRTSSSEAIRIVRTNLEFVLSNIENDNNAKTIFLTSTLSGEGKTFIAINLAATIAISGKKVLLIGMDIRNPKLDEYVKLPSRGLTNYLSARDSDIKDFIVNQKGYESFDILPAGVIPPNPAELLMGKKLDSMFEKLKLEYDYIVVDTAPVTLVTDTLLIAKNADAFVYVVRANYLDKSFLKKPEALYVENKLPNMCVLLNDTNNVAGYGYGYYKDAPKQSWYEKMFNFSFFSRSK